MKLDRTRRTLRVHDMAFCVQRGPHGVARIGADDVDALACGLGAVHAHDRAVQMVMTRIVGQGRIAELLSDTDATFAVDLYMRSVGFRREAEREVARLTPEARRFADAYAAGVNFVLSSERRPLELVLARHRPEPWTVADTLLTIKLMSFLGLAQTQQDMEKLIIQAIHGGAPVDRLRMLLAPHLDELDDETVELIRRLRHIEPLVPPEVRFLTPAPTVSASNNWAVSGARSASGAPLQCNDPHLEVNRLPAIWAEAEMESPDGRQVGITMPGVPGLIMGRTRSLSYGFTYGFMDMVDFFIEDCRDGAVKRPGGTETVDVRHETIRRRRGDDVEIALRETDLGVLEADPLSSDLADGLYLTRAWTGQRCGAAESLDVIRKLPRLANVAEAQQQLRHVSISCNWVIADRSGSIGYQQSGLLPRRRHSGLFPVPAWRGDLLWRGAVEPEALLSFADPDDGVIVTANNELNPPDGPVAVNLPMGSYRAERIRELLDARPLHDEASMRKIQCDLVSLQARRLMAIWRPLLPDTFAGRLLAQWDLRYDAASRGATLFETVYHELLARVCGDRLFGREVWRRLVDETAIVADYYHLFDAILLGDDRRWWGAKGRSAVLTEVFDELLRDVDPFAVMPWGRRRRVTMVNIFFDGRLPSFLGWDYGPIELEGCRATIVQGGLFTAHGRITTFAPSWRYIADLASDSVSTALAGGPSGRRFSRWYTTDIERWLKGGYKRIDVVGE